MNDEPMTDRRNIGVPLSELELALIIIACRSFVGYLAQRSAALSFEGLTGEPLEESMAQTNEAAEKLREIEEYLSVILGNLPEEKEES